MRVDVLTVLVAKNLNAGKYADGQGLWLVKRSRQAGKWILRLATQGQRREMGLARWSYVTTAEARDKAAEAKRQRRDGNDPILDRIRTSSKPMTLKQVIESCFEARKAELKGEGEAGRWMSPLTLHAIPKLGSYPVEEIDQHVLKELLAPIWHKKADTADKVLTRIGLAL